MSPWFIDCYSSHGRRVYICYYIIGVTFKVFDEAIFLREIKKTFGK